MDFEKIRYENIDEELVKFTHSSGLKVYVLPKKGYYKKFAAFGTNYGSVDSEFFIPGETKATKVPDGIAHFLEHKLFEQKDGNVMDKFSALGASPNAYTSFNQTVYWFTCTEKFDECFKLLLEYVQNPYITPESVEREKGIIGQEIKMYEDNPGWRVYFNLLNAMFKVHPAKKDIAGTVESIADIDKDILYKCFNTFYHPSNMVVIVGGDIDEKEVFESVEKFIQKKEPIDDIKRIYPKEPDEINQHYIEEAMEVSTPIFYMGFKDKRGSESKDETLASKDLAKRESAIKIIQEMIFGKSSKIFNLLYSKGLVDGSFGYDYTIEKDYSYSMLGGESKNPQEVKDIIVEEIRKLKDGDFNDADFEMTKKMMKGRFVRNLNSVEKPCRAFMSTYFKGINVFDYYDLYTNIDFEYTKNVFVDHFAEDMLAMSVVKPFSKKES